MARRLSPSQFRSHLRQVENKLRQAANRQKQAIDRYNREARAFNQRQERAVANYNRAARAHNAKVRANRRSLEQELHKLQRLSSQGTRRTNISSSARRVHAAFVEVRQRHQRGHAYPGDMYSLFENEAANSIRAANSVDYGDSEDAKESSDLRTTALDRELESFSPDLAQRWAGALYSLSPENPDAARHFCTSARECIVTLLDIAAPDKVVEQELTACSYTSNGRVTRRSKLKYLLSRKGLTDDAAEEFIEEDVEDILGLFRVFNDGAHGAAGRFNLNELMAVKERAEGGIRLLYELAH